MNELKLLGEWDADAPALTDAARERARDRLYAVMREPVAEARPAAVGRRPLLRIALAGAVGAAVTTTVVVTRGDETSPRTQPVSVATVLRGAAEEDRRTEKAVAPRDDQFIYSKEIIKETPVGGGPTKTYVDESWRSVDGSKRGWVSELGHGWWVPPDKPGESVWPPARWSELEKLPTDPHKLTVALAAMGGKPDYDQPVQADMWPTVNMLLAGLLRAPVLPEGLRAAAFEAFAYVPGVRVLPGAKDGDGRPGIGVQYVGKPGGPWAAGGPVFVFAPEIYRYLGFRDKREAGGKKYDQWAYEAASGVVDRVKQRP